ncbi:DUF5658 family protein [Cytobacillus firmus]
MDSNYQGLDFLYASSRDYKVVNLLKGLFLYLSFLNFIDGTFTFLGLQFSIIEERNPLMAYLFILDPIVFLALKISLSILLCIFPLINFIPSYSIVKVLILGASALYTFVCFIHFIWIIELIT